MTRELVQKVLKEDADSNRPAHVDLWPSVQNGLPRTGSSRLQARGLPVRLGLKPFALAGVLVAALLAFGILLPATLMQPAPVSAAELLARAEQTTSEGGMRSFHGVMVAEQRNYATEKFNNAREERWYLAPHSYRSEARITTKAGEVGVLTWVTNGETGWKSDSTIGAVQPLNAKEIKSEFGSLNLAKLLSTDIVRYFYDAQVTGSEKVGGRTAHVIELTLKPQEQWPPNMYPSNMERVKMWVDAEAFFITRLQAWDAEGNLLSTSQYESFEINGTVDPEVFNAQPPASK